MTEERVTTTETQPAPAVETVQTAPDTVVERRPAQTVVQQPATSTVVSTNDDPVGNAMAASTLIQTIVWSVVVLVLLVVALWLLHVYAGLF